MKRKELVLVFTGALVAAIVALALSGAVFNSPATRSQVPVIDKINPSFPDVKNDSNYNSFLNKNALDPTQPIQIGNTQNTSPFNPSQ